MTYEDLEKAYEHIPTKEMDLSGVRGLKGLYAEGSIAIHKDIPTNTEKACILAEELGHHFTTAGNILDQTSADNRKQEYRARLWAYNKQIGLYGIIKSHQRGCRNLSDTADYLGVTENFLKEALSCYREKYGTHKQVEDYLICFEPLGVVELSVRKG